MNPVENRFIVETDKGLIDVSGCSIKISERGPIMPYDPPNVFYALVATEKKETIASFKHEEKAEVAYEKIKEALEKNESYADIRECIADDENYA